MNILSKFQLSSANGLGAVMNMTGRSRAVANLAKPPAWGRHLEEKKMLIFGHFPNRGGGLWYFCSLIFGLSFGQYIGGGALYGPF